MEKSIRSLMISGRTPGNKKCESMWMGGAASDAKTKSTLGNGLDRRGAAPGGLLVLPAHAIGLAIEVIF